VQARIAGTFRGRAVDLVHPRRLVVEPAHDPVPTKADGGLDWPEVKRIVIVEIVDYH